MLTIGQLAAYSGGTVRAVRHYHQIGLLPEPERDASARWVAAVGQLLPTHAYADTSWQIAGDSLALRIIDQGHPGQILHVVPHHRTLDLPRCAARAIVATIRAEYILVLTVETADEILTGHREA